MYIIHLRGHLNAHQYAPALTHCMNPWNACHQSVLCKGEASKKMQTHEPLIHAVCVALCTGAVKLLW